jgi:hypothetical protein
MNLPEFLSWFERNFRPQDIDWQERAERLYEKINGAQFVTPEITISRLGAELSRLCPGNRHEVTFNGWLTEPDRNWIDLMEESAKWSDADPVVLKICCNGGFEASEKLLRDSLTGNGLRKLIVIVNGYANSAATITILASDWAIMLGSSTIAFHRCATDSILMPFPKDYPDQSTYAHVPAEQRKGDFLTDLYVERATDAFVNRAMKSGRHTRKYIEAIAAQCFKGHGKEFSAGEAFDLGLADCIV